MLTGPLDSTISHFNTRLIFHFETLKLETQGSNVYPLSGWICSLWDAAPLTFARATIWLKYKWMWTFCLKYFFRASLVAQWLRIRLPMQATGVRAFVREDPTCHRATKPVRHDYWACALEPTSHNYWAHEPQLLKPAHLEPVLCNKRSHRNEKPMHRNEE